MYKLINGDVLESLRDLPDNSVHCVVTSPPYWGLRDYGHDGQIGLEETPEDYVAEIVKVFSEIRRVLRDDGNCWLNLGDSYASAGGSHGSRSDNQTGVGASRVHASGGGDKCARKPPSGNKPKYLIGIPWRVAFALQADGWWLRQDIIWSKPNPMPESVRDRCTKSHEYVFLLTQSQRNFYDAEAIKVEASVATMERNKHKFNGAFKGQFSGTPGEERWQEGRAIEKPQFAADGLANRRSVWTITTKPFRGAHFATMPPDLAETCIKAGTSKGGCCPYCGSPWQRVTERTKLTRKRPNDYVKRTGEAGTGTSCANSVAGVAVKTLGWSQTCKCEQHEPVPCVVLDPFTGSGTTLYVAEQLGRDSIGIELNPEYLDIAEKRLGGHFDKKKGGKKKTAKVGTGQKELF